MLQLNYIIPHKNGMAFAFGQGHRRSPYLQAVSIFSGLFQSSGPHCPPEA